MKNRIVQATYAVATLAMTLTVLGAGSKWR